MIRVLLAIQFGLTVAAAFAVLEALAPEPPRRRIARELAAMILESERRIEEGGDTTITPEEITEVEHLLDMTPFSMVLTGKYDDAGWPFVTIGRDSKN